MLQTLRLEKYFGPQALVKNIRLQQRRFYRHPLQTGSRLGDIFECYCHILAALFFLRNKTSLLFCEFSILANSSLARNLLLVKIFLALDEGIVIGPQYDFYRRAFQLQSLTKCFFQITTIMSR